MGKSKGDTTQLVTLQVSIDPIRQKKISLDVFGTIRDVSTALSVEGLTLILPEDQYNKPFSLRLTDKPIETLLEAVKIAIGEDAQIIQRDGYVYIGKPDEGDQVIDVFRLPGDAGAYVNMFTTAAGVSSTGQVLKDHLLLRGTKQQIERARLLYAEILKRRRQYCVDVVFAELTEQQAQNAGIDITLSGAAELALDGTKSLFSSGYDLSAILRGVLSASGTKTNQAQWQSNRLFCVEGQAAEMMIGDQIAIRRRITTDTGFIQEADTQTFEAGTQLTVTVYGVSDGLIKVDLVPEVSFVREYLDGVPTISKRRVTSTAYCSPNAVIVLGGQNTESETLSGNTVPFTKVATNRNENTSKGRTFIFLQIREILPEQEQKPEPETEREKQEMSLRSTYRKIRLSHNHTKGFEEGTQTQNDRVYKKAFEIGKQGAIAGVSQDVSFQVMQQVTNDYANGIDEAEITDLVKDAVDEDLNDTAIEMDAIDVADHDEADIDIADIDIDELDEADFEE